MKRVRTVTAINGIIMLPFITNQFPYICCYKLNIKLHISNMIKDFLIFLMQFKNSLENEENLLWKWRTTLLHWSEDCCSLSSNSKDFSHVMKFSCRRSANRLNFRVRSEDHQLATTLQLFKITWIFNKLTQLIIAAIHLCLLLSRSSKPHKVKHLTD